MLGLNYVFKKYTGNLRNLKAVYFVNNLLNAEKLKHNRPLYKKYGLKKSIFSSIGGSDFEGMKGDIPWTNRPEMEVLYKEKKAELATFSPEIQAKMDAFLKDGYMVLESFYSPEEVEELRHELDILKPNLEQHTNYTGKKIPDIHRNSSVVNTKFTRNPEILRLLSFILGRQAIPFQSIGFYEGSEQRAHSDYIHMSTFPDGYLAAAWVALEECTPENGQLFYFPESQKLPIIRKKDYDTGTNFWKVGDTSYVDYENALEAQLEKTNLEKLYFNAKPGDLLIWNGHFVHGGSPIKQKGSSRRSLVSHYFAEGVICYHDITQRPALLF